MINCFLYKTVAKQHYLIAKFDKITPNHYHKILFVVKKENKYGKDCYYLTNNKL